MVGPESPVERARVEYVTRNFGDLQGLRMLPLAGVFAAWGASEAGLLTGTAWWLTFAGAVVVAAIGMPLISRWYTRRFGRVAPIPDPRRSARVAAAAAGLLVVGIGTMMLGAAGLIPRADLVALPGIVLGVALGLFGVSQGPVARREHPWMWRYGIGLAVTSAVPLGLWMADGLHPVNASGVMEFVIAGFMTIASIDTHRALTRMLRAAHPAAGESA